MAEWSNAPVLKTGIPQGIGGSNPPPTANLSLGLALETRREPALGIADRKTPRKGVFRFSPKEILLSRMKFSVAVVQFKINYAFPNDNQKRMDAYIAQAKENQADLVIFPEESVEFSALKDGEEIGERHYLKYFVDIAKKYAVDIVPGSWLVRDGDKVLNRTHYIDYEGNILGTYDKRNLWRSKAKFVTPGISTLPFDTRFGKVGLALCWDIMDSSIFREQTGQGAEIFLVPSHWVDDEDGLNYSPGGVNGIDAMCLARAYENNAVVIFCNAGGEFDGKGRKLIGRSQIAAPMRGTLQKATAGKETMFIQEIDTGVIRKAEELNGIRQKLSRSGRVAGLG